MCSTDLVSNLSLVMGVAGANLSDSAILITGIAGLLAGACSMAMGEWISVQSARELFTRELAVERREIAEQPEVEHQELVTLYIARGLGPAAAGDVADVLMANPEQALEVMAREELGIDPQDLGGSAWVAAGSSFALFGVGAMITRVTGRSPWLSGLRQLAIGLAAAGTTYLVGLLLGVSVGV